MRKILFLAAIIACSVVSKADGNDPILMTINGEGVTLSEFEYLYHKNNQQQIEKETLEQYLERFIVYKLKVADARAAGIDTTAAFKAEFTKYRDDLASPYMVDSATIERLVLEAYDRKQREVEVSHIMLPLSASTEEMNATKARLDSIRQCALNGEDFGELALKFSIDPGVKNNNGNQGYVTVGRFPIEFELASYNTPVGEISEPFVTDFGYHIVLVHKERPSQGQVLVEHILKLYQGGNDSLKLVKKQQIDSIYQLVVAGADFEELAKTESEDKGSAPDGGRLPWFGTGMMVPQFERMAFDMDTGAICEPFETTYGYHIIKKLDSRGIGTLEENRKQLLNQINGDKRRNLPKEAKIAQLKTKHSYAENDKWFKKIEKKLDKTPYDSLFVVSLMQDDSEMFSIAKEKTPVSEVAATLNPSATFETTAQAVYYIRAKMAEVVEKKLFETEKEAMKTEIPEYGNLVNEYFNGMMLYEISNRNVWGRSNTDTTGLENFFEQHRDSYTWEQPKFKGTVIFVTNDSVEALVREALTEMSADTMAVGLKNRFKRHVKVEKALVAKGESGVVDALVFGGERVPAPQRRFENYFLYEGRIVEAPEEVADVRGLVTTDYQNKLEEDWVAELKEKYPVEVNEEVLKMVK